MAGQNGNSGDSGKTILGLGLITMAGIAGYALYKMKGSTSTQTLTSTAPPPPPPTSTTPVLTTINWSVNPTSLPYTGGSLTFNLQALDQNGNPYAGASPILVETEQGYTATLGTFPATNTSGLSSLTVNIPPNSTQTTITMVFNLEGF